MQKQTPSIKVNSDTKKERHKLFNSHLSINRATWTWWPQNAIREEDRKNKLTPPEGKNKMLLFGPLQNLQKHVKFQYLINAKNFAPTAQLSNYNPKQLYIHMYPKLHMVENKQWNSYLWRKTNNKTANSYLIIHLQTHLFMDTLMIHSPTSISKHTDLLIHKIHM